MPKFVIQRKIEGKWWVTTPGRYRSQSAAADALHARQASDKESEYQIIDEVNARPPGLLPREARAALQRARIILED